VEFEQLRLLPPPRPFLRRLGPEFFKELPRCPGVYLMRDRSEKIIYIGQSCNLKQRLSSYKYLQPEKISSKIRRLILRVEKVEWQTCQTPDEAALLENKLIGAHNPRYNTANVYPQKYRFIQMIREPGGLRLSLQAEAAGPGEFFGAFKGAVFSVYASMVRALWTLLHRACALDDYPCSLLSDRPRKSLFFRATGEQEAVCGLLADYFLGNQNGLSEFLKGSLSSQERQPFLAAMLEADLAAIESFFAVAEQHQKLRRAFGIESSFIPREKLNEYLLRSRKRKKPTGALPEASTLEEASTESGHLQTLPIPPSRWDRSPERAEPDSRPLSYQPLFL
jgi:hypothetical protein